MSTIRDTAHLKHGVKTETQIETSATETEAIKQEAETAKTGWKKWWEAFKAIFPFYLGLHLGLFAITLFMTLFIIGDGSDTVAPISTLWKTWRHWDANHYISIAQQGYFKPTKAAFFPLYPLLIRGILALRLFNSPEIAGLLISNLSWLGFMIVFFQLVREDFDEVIAQRAILYHSLFPTAMYLAGIYNESLLLFIVATSFYHMRRGNWWLAGCIGIFATLTRSVGVFLVIPFFYEYIRQHNFQWRALFKPQILSIGLVGVGIGVYMIFCYMKFDDFMMWSTVQSHWGRYQAAPWVAIKQAFSAIKEAPGFLSFRVLRNLMDLGPDLLVLFMLILSVVGPWRLPISKLSYCLFAWTMYIFFHVSPVHPPFPLISVGRFVVEIFPAFIIMANIGKNKYFHYSYVFVSGSLFFFFLIWFLTNHWIV